MKTWPLSTLVALATLGSAHANEPTLETGEAISSVSRRGVAQDYLVLPAGGELTGQMRFVMAQPVFSDEKLRFSDLALFGIGGRWSLLSKLELSGHVDLLAKQPSHTDEKPWQSVAIGLRSPLGKRKAIALQGSGGHLVDHSGMWTKQALTVQWRVPIADLLTFDLAATVDGVGLTAPRSTSAFITEVAGTASALFHADGKWGAWVGLGYAVPVIARGSDPTTGLAVDPQPRLDFRVGTVLSLVKEWDLFAEFAVVDRGDLAAPATRLPILDGGFDQQQVIFGVTRHFDVTPKHSRDAMVIGTR